MSQKYILIALLSLGGLFLIGFWYSANILAEYKEGKISRLQKCKENSGNIEVKNSTEIVLIGDSRISEWAEFWPSDFPETANRGVPGATSLETLCGNKQFSSIKNKVVVIQVGINDAVAISLMNSTQNQIEQEAMSFLNIAELVDIVDNDNKVVLLTLVPPIDTDIFRRFAWGSNVETIAERLSQKLHSLASESVKILDAHNSFYDSQKQLLRSEFSRNALHWNHAGYQQLNDDLAEFIN